MVRLGTLGLLPTALQAPGHSMSLIPFPGLACRCTMNPTRKDPYAPGCIPVSSAGQVSLTHDRNKTYSRKRLRISVMLNLYAQHCLCIIVLEIMQLGLYVLRKKLASVKDATLTDLYPLSYAPSPVPGAGGCPQPRFTGRRFPRLRGV